MLAESILQDVTEAEGQPLRVQKPRPERYVPAEPLQESGLVFPGPRMQLRAQIVWGDRRYHLRDVFVIDLTYAEGAEVFANHRSLPVHGHGSRQKDALESFCEAFDFQWRNLVDVDEASLTPGGLRRRRAMIDAVEKVDQISG